MEHLKSTIIHEKVHQTKNYSSKTITTHTAVHWSGVKWRGERSGRGAQTEGSNPIIIGLTRDDIRRILVPPSFSMTATKFFSYKYVTLHYGLRILNSAASTSLVTTDILLRYTQLQNVILKLIYNTCGAYPYG
ncbi:unnamed protein product [Leptosia nina]|uniref:Uncharacterized protein n=1 Tax=Leptosia nina TaxID=320188 RepID=A0AAV1JF84_9NEOP